MAARTPPHRRPTLRHASITTLAIITLGIATGCSGDTDDGLPPPHPGFTPTPHNTPTLHLTLEEQQAVDEANELFNEFMQLYTDLASSGEPPGEEATTPLYVLIAGYLSQDVNDELVDNYLANRRMDGAVSWEFVEPVEVVLDPKTTGQRDPSIILRYCINADPWTTVDTGTGDPIRGTESVLVQGAHLTDVRFTYFDRGAPDDPRWYAAELGHEGVIQRC